jgi:phage terminase small subunit
MAEITPKQQRFVEEYLVDLNGTQAAIRAGYSAKTAQEQASDLLSKPMVQQAVQAARKAQKGRTGIEADRVLRELARLGLSDIRKAFAGTRLLNPDEWDDDTAAAVASIEVETRTEGRGEDAEHYTVTKLKLWDKNSALEKLCKHLGLYERDNSQFVAALGVVMLPRKGA